MEEECYENAEIKKIHAVKELFDNFATRSMAYDFHHVIGLVKFDSMVKMLHTFTENLEKFKVIAKHCEDGRLSSGSLSAQEEFYCPLYVKIVRWYYV